MSRPLSIAGAARQLKMARSTLRDWVRVGDVPLVDGKIPAHRLPQLRELADLRLGTTRKVTAEAPEKQHSPDESELIARLRFGQDVVMAAVPALGVDFDTAPGFLRVEVLLALLWGASEVFGAYSLAKPASEQERHTGSHCARLAAILARAAGDLDAALKSFHPEDAKMADELEQRANALDDDGRAHLIRAADVLRVNPTNRGSSR